MSQANLRLDEIFRRGIPVLWHEGVAVVQAVCRALPDAGAASARFPSATEILIAADGQIDLLGKPSGTPGVVAAGRLLGEMLQTDVPVRLRLLHSEAVATTPAFKTLQEFSEALAYFERPDGQETIAQLYARAGAVPAPVENPADVAMDDFLPENQELTAPSAAISAAAIPAPAAAAGEPVIQRPDVPYSPPQPRSRRTPLYAAAAVLVFGVIASGAFLSGGLGTVGAPGESEESAAAPGSAAVPPALEKKSKAAAGRGAPDNQAPNRAKAESRKESAAPAQDVRNRNRPDVQAAPQSTLPSLHPAPLFIPLLSGREGAPGNTAYGLSNPLSIHESLVSRGSDRDASGGEGEVVYSRVNQNVVPPVAIRPHLPSEPPADYRSDHLMVLDLVVTSKGDVESVRLQTDPRTINDYMIVSAAKAWLFAPAKLNGKPVKYRHRIRFVVP
jgi:hypothetical protein